MQNSGLPEVAEFMSSLWEYVKDHYNVGTDQEYWQSVIGDGNTLLEKYKGSSQYKFFESLVFACINAWEKQIRRS